MTLLFLAKRGQHLKVMIRLKFEILSHMDMGSLIEEVKVWYVYPSENLN